ncbi:methyltransferase domain-containing protein [Amycolatopsis acidicola]|uniref:Methyltransferase domain-containing protein n=1 Tax=Amycolatopsis acidicola TaxID=2596893 RepID=A0A5N0UVA4_9PSEU|nr:class I SAM-dependent methyltransferase [Amycolatopsis acidicola]KAA9154495.1 methyltransferase domain-containing protein [Amycolatopsis acidicola]
MASHDFPAGKLPETSLEIRLPQRSDQVDQDAEHCSVLVNGVWQDIRFHDYARIYRIPGLYEQLFHDVLDCQSPDVIGKVLKEELQTGGYEPESLRVLDLGAGNGLVGEQLRRVGPAHLVGVDIIPEAREAALRDRPDVYDAYHVADLTNLPADLLGELTRARFNTLCCVAALGYADIPPAAFSAAFNLISDRGWIAFNIKDRFLSDEDTSGFATFIRRLRDEGVLELLSSSRYRHRRNVNGEPLYYVALVGRKHRDIPAEFLD